MKGRVLIALFAAAGAVCATAAPVYFPGTGSYYDVVYTKMSWDQARIAASESTYLGVAGRLATVTSEAENDFIVNNVLTSLGDGDSFWLGGYQPDGPNVAPAEGWEWITGEPWSYTNWRLSTGEPNDFFGPPGENCLEMFNGSYNGTWNDLAGDNVGLSEGFVIEYAAVPEPSGVVVFLLGVAGAVGGRRARVRGK